MSNDSTYVVLGDHYWQKDEDLYYAVEQWLERIDFSPKSKNVLIVRVNAKPEDVSVNGLGDISYPEGAELTEKLVPLDTSLMSRWLSTLQECIGEIEDKRSEVANAVTKASFPDY